MGSLKLGLVAMTATVVALCAGCKEDKEEPKETVHTVAYYLHDIDLAETVVKKAKARSSVPTEDEMNASYAMAQFQDPTFIECWTGRPRKSANTDHACLDRKGYAR